MSLKSCFFFFFHCLLVGLIQDLKTLYQRTFWNDYGVNEMKIYFRNQGWWKEWPENCLWNKDLTHRQKMPGDCRCGKACEDIVSVGEVCEVRVGHSLTPTLTPHQHLTTLCFRHWCVTGVTCSNLHHSVGDKWVTQMLLINLKYKFHFWLVNSKTGRKQQ